MKPSASSDRSPPRWLTLLALALGVGLFLALPLGVAGEHARAPAWRWLVAITCASLAFVPKIGKAVAAALDRIRHPSPRRRAVAAVGIAAASSAYLLLTAVNQDRDFFPKTEDECSYALQTQMVAHGHLWLPQHPLADFFDAFQILVKPVYASMYFPGTALLNAPAVWLGLPGWVIPLLIAAAVVGLSYRVVTELTDGVGGALAACLLVSITWYRTQSIMLMAQLPTVLLSLLMLWAWLRSRSRALTPGSEPPATPRIPPARRHAWIALIGALAGWAAITRPLDALCAALPVGVALALDLRHERRRLLVATALLIASAAPFLALQLALNKGVTGHWTQTPFDLYAARDYPGTTYGFHAVAPDAHPASPLPLKQRMYQTWVKPFIARHQPGQLASDWWHHRLPAIADATLPARPLLIFLPVGLLALTDRRRWALAGVLPLFAALYVGYTFFLEHYALTVVPAIALLTVTAGPILASVWPRHARPISTTFVLFALGFAATSLYELNHWDNPHAVDDEPFRATWLRELHDAKETNAIILFRLDAIPATSAVPIRPDEEPVYNIAAPWPDDQPLIRAHDLGPRNVELFRYYAKLGQNRTLFRLDRTTGKIDELGRVFDLAATPP